MIAIYTRQSKDKKDSISIETQIEFCKREVYGEDFKTYEDKGFTGANINRPDFQELMKDIKDGLITKVIVYRLDRISRSILNFTSMMEIFNKYNVEFVSCTEKLDTTTPAGRMVVNILIVFAQYERESTQQRITDNYYERAKLGVFLGGNTPYGYDSTVTKIMNKKMSMLVPGKDAEKVKKIFDMYVDGISLGDIARYLNSNADGKNFHSKTVSRIIRNPVYVKADYNIYRFLDMKNCILINDLDDFKGINGLTCYGEGNTKFKDISGYNVAVGLHEGIIDSKTWLQAQYRIYNNEQFANNGTSKNTWLSGISKCGTCGYAMTYKSVTKKLKNGIKTYKHLRCSGKTYKHCDGDLNYIRLEDAEQSVFEMLAKYIKNKNIKMSDDKDDSKIKDLELELSSIDTKINNLINNMMESNEITVQYINKAINELHGKKQTITKEIMKYENTKTSNISINAESVIKNWDKLDVEVKKSFARTYISQIRFFTDGIEVDFK